MSHPVIVPLLNPNEPEAVLAALHVSQGQHVLSGQPLFTLETTKTTAEVPAEVEGFIVNLTAQTGQLVQAGDVLFYIAETPDWQPPQAEALPFVSKSDTRNYQADIPAGLRISQPALELALAESLDLAGLPRDIFITENIIRTMIDGEARAAQMLHSSLYDPTAIIIYGGGGHGKALIELVRAMHIFQIAAILDDGLPAGSTVLGIPVLGGGAKLAELAAQGIRQAVNAVGGIGNLAVRKRVFERLASAGFTCPPVVHPSAVVEASASLAAGVQVFALSYVGSQARLGFGAIINTGAIISHDCQLGDYVNISPGAILAGEVLVGDEALVGMGATINLRAQIGASARIGNNATVKSDVPANTIVRAGLIWPS
jgi:sugar O-acyltransferase (sialic acid O-acetyltransferase NeuD family)